MPQNPNPFSARYKTLSDAKLLAILNNSQNYQPIAIEAANAELESRQLSADQIEQIKADLEITEQKKIVKQQKNEAIEQLVLDVVNPQAPIIRYIYIAVFINILLYVIAVKYAGRFLFADMLSPFLYSVNIIHAIIPFILFPVGIVLFVLKKRSGWIIIIAINIYKALLQLLILQRDVSIKMDHLFANTIRYRYLFTSAGVTLLSILVCIFICRADIRAEYKVNDRMKVLSISAGAIWLVYDLLKT